MKTSGKTEEQFAQEEKERREKYLWPAGTICDYEIASALEKVSSKGNEMLELRVKVYNDKGEHQFLDDYLGHWNEWKLRRICEANGLLAEFDRGEIQDHMLYEKTGKCRLKIQKGADKGDGTFYSDKNVIDEYYKSDSASAPNQKPKAVELDDGIPF